jgi:hypothetical protein
MEKCNVVHYFKEGRRELDKYTKRLKEGKKGMEREAMEVNIFPKFSTVFPTSFL